jgi:hypothetical protein
MSELREHCWAVLTSQGHVGGFTYEGALNYGRTLSSLFWIVTASAVRRLMEKTR